MSSTLEKKQAATQLSGPRISPLAGKLAPREMLVDLSRLEKEYFDRKPDLEDANQFVVFGTSGHRRLSSFKSFGVGRATFRRLHSLAKRESRHFSWMPEFPHLGPSINAHIEALPQGRARQIQCGICK